MWPLSQLQIYLQQIARRPPLRSYNDTLSYLAGGMPTVVDQNLGPGTYGEYLPKQPMFGILQDSLRIDPHPRPDAVPREFVLAHEMGHKVYYNNEPLRSAAERQTGPSPELQRLIERLHGREPYSNTSVGEPFAQTFGVAMGNVRRRPYTPPVETGPVKPEDVSMIEQWIRAKLAQAPR